LQKGKGPDGQPIPQGRWLSRNAGEQAVANLDTAKMVPGKGYSTPIPKGAGEVVRARAVDQPFPKKTPATEKVTHEPADKAVVILGKDGIIHSFPIGPENSAYNNPAPTTTPK
jgi:hypothetical protein